MNVFTVAAANRLDQAKAMARSVLRHEEGARVVVLVAESSRGESIAIDPFHEVLFLSDLPEGRDRAWLFLHDCGELCCALKAIGLSHLLDRGEGGDWIYVDADCLAFDGFGPFRDELARHSVLLTPHGSSPASSERWMDEHLFLQAGIFNAGCLGVRFDDEEGRAFLRWWTGRVRKVCVQAPERQFICDQLWLNLVPTLFPRAGICRDPGMNVSYWNLLRRELRRDEEGRFFCGNHPLRLFHYSQRGNAASWDGAKTGPGGAEPVDEILKTHDEALRVERTGEEEPATWSFGFYDDGTPVPLRHRRVMRWADPFDGALVDPFAASASQRRLLDETDTDELSAAKRAIRTMEGSLRWRLGAWVSRLLGRE